MPIPYAAGRQPLSPSLPVPCAVDRSRESVRGGRCAACRCGGVALTLPVEPMPGETCRELPPDGAFARRPGDGSQERRSPRCALARPDGLLVQSRQGTDLTPALTRRCGSSSAAPPSRSSARSTPSGSRLERLGGGVRAGRGFAGLTKHRVGGWSTARTTGTSTGGRGRRSRGRRVLPRRPGLRRAVLRTRWTTSAQTTLTARTVVPRRVACARWWPGSAAASPGGHRR